MKFSYKYFLFFLIVYQVRLFSQNIDSIKTQLNHQKDTILLKSILAIGNTYYDTGLLDSATYYFNTGLNNANQQKNQKFIANFYIKLGLMEREKGVYNKASEYYYEALEVADKNKFDSEKASCYNGIAIISAIQKDHEKAFQYYNKSLDIYKSANNQKGIGSI